ncbi:MAG: BBP7 family outer membrane beta-barrel protein [Gemmataceae bacterium]
MSKGLLVRFVVGVTLITTLGAVPAKAAETVDYAGVDDQAGCAAEAWASPPVCLFPCEHMPCKFWVTAEYLLWWVKDAPLPVPLVTTGPLTSTDPTARPGILGEAGTQILMGGDSQNMGTFSGGRFFAGWWLDNAQTCGLEGGYFFLGRRTASQSIASLGVPPLSIPFFNPITNQEDTTGLAVPVGIGFSGVGVLESSTFLQGAELNGLVNLSKRCRLDLIGGFRYLNLDERLSFVTDSTNRPPLPPDVFVTKDRFRTDNDFYGGQLGLRTGYRHGWWDVSGLVKVALGGVQQRTNIRGILVTNDFTDFGPVQAFPAGYLGLPTNNGVHSRNRFAVVPEVNLNVGCEPVDGIRFFAGYTFLYISSVARPGDQIDRVINPSQGPGFTGIPSTELVGPARPTYLGASSGFWAQGLNFGLEVRY